MSEKNPSPLALVLSGGGARGAYEAGVIHYLRTGLPADIASKTFQIQCGSSAGAINTAAMVSMAHDPVLQGNHLKDLWLSIRQDDIYRRDFSAAGSFFLSSLGGMMRNLTTFDPFSIGKKKGPHLTSFLDTSPLREFLKKNIPWGQLRENLQNGPVGAMSVTATNIRTGYGELFVSKKKTVKYTGDYLAHEVDFEVDHIMASAAIPIIFPSVHVGKSYYTDGGLRIFTPMSPAIQLGSDRLIIVGLRHPPTTEERKEYESREVRGAPSLAELMGRIMNGLFLDRVQFDLEQLKRIDDIIELSEKVYGNDYLEKLNREAEKDTDKHRLSCRGLKKIRAVEILPSEFVSQIFGRWFHRKKKKDFKFSTLEKLLTRLLDIDTEGGIELFSYLTFANEYIKELIDLGYEDAKRNRNRIIELMGDD